MFSKTLKKPLITTLISIFAITLGGCFNFGGDNTDKTAIDERFQLYENSEFSMTIPKEWDIITKTDFTSDVPAETAVVFRNNVKNETFTANVNVVKNSLQESISSLDYAKMVINRQKTGLFDYKESRKEDAKIEIGGKQEDTFLTSFTAKKGTEENLIRYFQTCGVKGNSAYIVTGAISPQENENTAKTVEDIIKSFKIK